MANKNLWLSEFDPGVSYVARKVLKLPNRLIHPGQKVPKKHFTVRRLRQLYEGRYIVKKEQALDFEPTVRLSPYSINPRGPGWADILKHGEYFEGPLRPKEAQARLKELAGEPS